MQQFNYTYAKVKQLTYENEQLFYSIVAKYEYKYLDLFYSCKVMIIETITNLNISLLYRLLNSIL